MAISDVTELLKHVNSNWALFAVIVFSVVWFFRKPLELLIDGLVPGEHSSVAKNVVKNVFVFGLLGVILVFVLQAQQQSNELKVDITNANIPIEMRKLDIKANDLYGLTSNTVNTLLSEFKQEQIGIDTDKDEAAALTKELIRKVLRMKGDLTIALSANENIRNRAIEALSLLEAGNFREFKNMYKAMEAEGIFDECTSAQVIKESEGLKNMAAPATTDTTTPSTQVSNTSEPKNISMEELKKLRFLLSVYGNWKIPTGTSDLKIYPALERGAEFMMLRERMDKGECASIVGISMSLDGLGYHYTANEKSGNCFNGGLQSVAMPQFNILGLSVDSLLTQYKRTDMIRGDVYDEIVYKEKEPFRLNEHIDDVAVLERLRNVVDGSDYNEQIKFLGKLYFVYGLSVAEIRDIPFPLEDIFNNLDSKLETVKRDLSSDVRTESAPLVTLPLLNVRVGYESDIAKTVLTSRPKPPSGISVN